MVSGTTNFSGINVTVSGTCTSKISNRHGCGCPQASKKKLSKLDVPTEETLNNVLLNNGTSIQGTIKQSRLLSPVLEEVDELRKYVPGENTTLNEKSRPKRSGCDKSASSVQPPMKISRKRTFADAAIVKSEKMKTSHSPAATTDATELTPPPPRTSLFDVVSSEEFASVIDPTTLRKQKVLSS